MATKRYGLQLRIPPSQKQAAAKPLARPPPAFAADDDDDVERDISRQAAKKKADLKVEEQHKKAMEEDPSVFDYDGVYDDMKQQIARPRAEDRTERKSKYIGVLLEKQKERVREQEVIYERKLQKERSKDDHLFKDKEKFVTSAYKKKLAEQAKWLEEEKMRQIREEKEDVTKKSDLSDFYFGLNKNIAFGGGLKESKKPSDNEQKNDGAQDVEGTQSKTEAPVRSMQEEEEVLPQKERQEVCIPAETSPHSQNYSEHAVSTSEVTVTDAISAHEKAKTEPESAKQVSNERFKRNEDALSAARERYLARKRARVQD